MHEDLHRPQETRRQVHQNCSQIELLKPRNNFIDIRSSIRYQTCRLYPMILTSDQKSKRTSRACIAISKLPQKARKLIQSKRLRNRATESKKLRRQFHQQQHGSHDIHHRSKGQMHLEDGSPIIWSAVQRMEVSLYTTNTSWLHGSGNLLDARRVEWRSDLSHDHFFRFHLSRSRMMEGSIWPWFNTPSILWSEWSTRISTFWSIESYREPIK